MRHMTHKAIGAFMVMAHKVLNKICLTRLRGAPEQVMTHEARGRTSYWRGYAMHAHTLDAMACTDIMHIGSCPSLRCNCALPGAGGGALAAQCRR